MMGFTSVIKVLTVPSQVMVDGGVFELLLLQDMIRNNKHRPENNKYIFFINDWF